MCVLLAGCAGSPARFDTPQAAGYYGEKPRQCVPYARDVSGLSIYGDAYTWWSQTSEARRGTRPQTGAVLVLAKTTKLTRGHLAVVTGIRDRRHITVTHSNWGSDFDSRRVIYEKMLVEDLSPHNDWSLLRFWNKDINAYGLPYPAYGFIYQ
ncbi:MAG: CHAP domain-containing protein [Rhodospirillales bacterium]|nr:CHAP domain-containing protein [Rhodospirillales bacterium]